MGGINRRAVAVASTLAVAAAAASDAPPPLPAPPRGYSTWQWNPGTHWGKGQGQYNAVDEVTARAQADAMVEKGLAAKGYNVFIVDEPCFAGRNAVGELQPNTTTWPSGFKAFGDYLRARGISLGIYTDAGPYTCQGCPGSAGHEAQDIATFASWGASYIKVDRCFGVDSNAMRENLPATYAKYRAAADRVPHRVQISAILAAADNCWEWCNNTCDHCRTTGDIRNSFGAMQGHVDTQSSIPFIADYAGPGYFNDLDMLIVGNMSQDFYQGRSALSSAETRAHLALWAVLKSPFLLSCDVRSLDGPTMKLLTNAHMLTILDDPLARQAVRLQTGAGSPTPTRLEFMTCPQAGQKPLPRQTWELTSQRGGQLASRAYPGRVISLSNCDADGRGKLQLCSTEPESVPQPPGPGCMNTSCPTASRFTMQANGAAAAADTGGGGLITSDFNSLCVEGIVMPQASAIKLSACDATNVKQLWTLRADGTLRASNNRTEQCATAELGPPAPAAKTMDVFATPLSDGGVAVVFYNRGTDPLSASLPLGELPGGKLLGQSASVLDVWAGKQLPQATGGVLHSGTVATHDVAFLRVGGQGASKH